MPRRDTIPEAAGTSRGRLRGTSSVEVVVGVSGGFHSIVRWRALEAGTLYRLDVHAASDAPAA